MRSNGKLSIFSNNKNNIIWWRYSHSQCWLVNKWKLLFCYLVFCCCCCCQFMGRSEISKRKKKVTYACTCLWPPESRSDLLSFFFFFFFAAFYLETLIVVVSVVVVAYGYSFFCIQITSTIIIVFILGSKNLIKK